MRHTWPIVVDIIVVAVVVSMIVFLYRTYRQEIIEYLFVGGTVNIYLRNIPLTVKVADTEAARTKGLGGVKKLPTDQGMLFIFERPGDYRFWMKDTLIPLDIFWLDNARKIVHIEENVRPESYPAFYGSPVPARFVIETNAFFAETFNLKPGDTVAIPGNRLPADLQ